MANLKNYRYKVLKFIVLTFFLMSAKCCILNACETGRLDLFDVKSYQCRGNFKSFNHSEKKELAAHCDTQIKRYESITSTSLTKKQHAHFLKALQPFAEKATLLRRNASNFKSFSATILILPVYYENTLSLWAQRKDFILSNENVIPQNLLHFTIGNDGEVLRDKEKVNAQGKILKVINSFARELSELHDKVWIHETQVNQVRGYVYQYAKQCNMVKQMFSDKTEEEQKKGMLSALLAEEENIRVRIQTWKGTANICQDLKNFLNRHKEIIAALRDQFEDQMKTYKASVGFLKMLSPSINTLFYFENIDESYNDALSLNFLQTIIEKLDESTRLAFAYRATLKELLKKHTSIVKKAKKEHAKIESATIKEKAEKTSKSHQSEEHNELNEINIDTNPKKERGSLIKKFIHKDALQSDKEGVHQQTEPARAPSIPHLNLSQSFITKSIGAFVSPRFTETKSAAGISHPGDSLAPLRLRQTMSEKKLVFPVLFENN